VVYRRTVDDRQDIASRPNDTYRSYNAVETNGDSENVGMNVPRMIATTTALGAALATPTQAQLLTHRDLSYPMARTIAEAAIESCGAKGYPVSAVVVDRAGEVMVAMRADGAAPHTMENARRKAYTALSFRMSTSDYAKRYAENNPVVHQQVTLPSVIAIPGGLPVKVGEDVIAGVGVSGSPGVDEPCVQAGIDKVAAQLR
jgi:uncharacterized protein GlcG (DUF336 family)